MGLGQEAAPQTSHAAPGSIIHVSLPPASYESKRRTQYVGQGRCGQQRYSTLKVLILTSMLSNDPRPSPASTSSAPPGGGRGNSTPILQRWMSAIRTPVPTEPPVSMAWTLTNAYAYPATEGTTVRSVRGRLQLIALTAPQKQQNRCQLSNKRLSGVVWLGRWVWRCTLHWCLGSSGLLSHYSAPLSAGFVLYFQVV